MKTYVLIFILAVFASCGGRGQKKTATAEGEQTTVENMETSVDDQQLAKTSTGHYTVEDTVRLQLGGKLYSFSDKSFREALYIDPDDSITVIGRNHGQPKQGEFYREYQFIVHNHHTPSHRNYEPAALDSLFIYRGITDNYGLDPLVQTEFIDPAIDDFLGYWLELTEYGGDYYLDEYKAPLNAFRLTDSIVTRYKMDGFEHHRIWKATVLPDGSLSIMYDKEYGEKLEPVDREREIYRRTNEYGESYFIPPRAIHNVELIQWTNTTGDII